MNSFLRALKEQRWDDHRYYHHSRINQSLHFISACTFLCTYVLLFTRPVAAALVGWLVAMVSRQVGHFFFEPKGYDEVNEATHQYKEDVKVGYNLRRKVILHLVWGLSPLLLLLSPTLFGAFKTPYTDGASFLHHMSHMWIVIGVGALLFRTIHLFFLRDVQTGLVWMTKILTDPFHDIWIYHKAPLALLRGELIDPMGTTQPQQQHA
jgi:hypothetical protein